MRKLNGIKETYSYIGLPTSSLILLKVFVCTGFCFQSIYRTGLACMTQRRSQELQYRSQLGKHD